jgi:hypothetical protein
MNNVVLYTRLDEMERDTAQLRRDYEQVRPTVIAAQDNPAGSLMAGPQTSLVRHGGSEMPAANANGIVLYSLYAPAIGGYVWQMLRPPSTDGEYYLRCNVAGGAPDVYWSTINAGASNFNTVELTYCNTNGGEESGNFVVWP